MTHICVSKLSIIGSDNGLSPGRRQAIIWTNAGILLIEPLGTNFSDNWIGIETFSIKEMHLKMSSAKWRLFGLGLNELNGKCLWLPPRWRQEHVYPTWSIQCLLMICRIQQHPQPYLVINYRSLVGKLRELCGIDTCPPAAGDEEIISSC